MMMPLHNIADFSFDKLWTSHRHNTQAETECVIRVCQLQITWESRLQVELMQNLQLVRTFL
jgi:hypothetical protein